MYDGLDVAYNMYKKDILAKREQYERISKDRLRAAMETKIRTTFIGALDSIEKHFGRQWGFGLPNEQLSEREMAIAEVWNSLREEILNKGNAQLRAARLEIEEYSIHWDKKKILFVTNDRSRENEQKTI